MNLLFLSLFYDHNQILFFTNNYFYFKEGPIIDFCVCVKQVCHMHMGLLFLACSSDFTQQNVLFLKHLHAKETTASFATYLVFSTAPVHLLTYAHLGFQQLWEWPSSALSSTSQLSCI